MHMEKKKCKSTYEKEAISTLQNLILKKKDLWQFFHAHFVYKRLTLCFNDLLIASSLLNII